MEWEDWTVHPAWIRILILLTEDVQVILCSCGIAELTSLLLECNCGLGSSDGHCSDDGACFCLPGVTGAKCDECLVFHFSLSSAGCQQCVGCEQDLIFQLSVVKDVITSIGLNFSLFHVLMRVDLTYYMEINSMLWDQILKRSNLHSDFTSIGMYLTMLTEGALESVERHLSATNEQVICHCR